MCQAYHKRQGMVVIARAQTACRATLAVALRASWRTIFFHLNTSSLDAYGIMCQAYLHGMGGMKGMMECLDGISLAHSGVNEGNKGNIGYEAACGAALEYSP